MGPLVSIAIPMYNGEKTIAMAVKSVILQTYTNWELFIIDDGSIDNSLNIIKEFQDSRITVVSDAKNLGLIARLNSIPSLVKGKYLARMDSDDIMHPDRILMQVQYMEINPNIDVIDCAIYIIDNYNVVYGIRNTEQLPTDRFSFLDNCLLTHPAVLAKKEWFDTHKYDGNYFRAEDYELWLRSHEDTKFGRVQLPLFFYREGSVNINNYVKSMYSVRKIISVYAPSLASPFYIWRSKLKTYIKQGLYILFGIFKCQKALTYFRNSNINSAEQKKAMDFISKIESLRI